MPNTFLPVDVTAEKLNFNQTVSTEQLFSLFADQPWAMWLDSCVSDHVDCQFDIIAWQPEVTLTTFANKTHINYLNKNLTEISTDDPLALINKIQQSIFGSNIKNHSCLPFIGGALGYFSYDLGQCFEQLPNKASNDIHSPDMAIGIYSQAIIFDHTNQQYWLICSPEKRLSLEKYLFKKISSLNSDKKSSPFALTTSWQSNMSKAEYADKFSQVQQYLLNGDCYQINLAQRFSAQYEGDEFTAYQTLRACNQAPFSAFIRIENYAILSVSPERFLQVTEAKVQSKPIKGTMPRSENIHIDKLNAQTLQHSEKDRAENVMIVDLLRNDMSKVCQVNTVKVPSLFAIESFPAVHHLVSTVEGVLSDKFNSCDLLRGAFPGGSITGAPKIRAMEIIEQLEPHKRSVYCGSIGYISRCGNMDTSITIRTLICDANQNKNIVDKPQTNTNKIYCWAGGGLVADSKVNSEYQETFDKVSKILPTLSALSSSDKSC